MPGGTCTVGHAPGRGSPGSQNKPLRAATRREALPVRRLTPSALGCPVDGGNPSGEARVLEDEGHVRGQAPAAAVLVEPRQQEWRHLLATDAGLGCGRQPRVECAVVQVTVHLLV